MKKADRFAIYILSFLMLLSTSAVAKSLYVIANINQNPTPIQAYNISGATLAFQAEYDVPSYAGGAVGLAVDTDSEFLFVTYEASNTIQLINAKTMHSEGSVTAPDASNLAGIVVNQGKSKVYTVDRWTNKLFIYSWNAATKTLTLDGGTFQNLPGLSGAFGIALDETHGILYISDYSSGDVKFYSISNWTTLAGSFTPSHSPIGIAVDPIRGYVYTGAGWAGSNLLSRWNLSTSTETTKNLAVGVMGITVDPQTGYVYCTTGYNGDDVRVFDLSLTETYNTGDIGNPTGLVVPGKDISYNPLNFSISDGGACARAGSSLTYKLCFDNAQNQNQVTGVTVTNTIPAHTTYVSASHGGSYDPLTSTVTWAIGTLAGGAPQQCITLTVQVDATLSQIVTIIDNSATITSNETGPTTRNLLTKICYGSVDSIMSLLLKDAPCDNVINLSLGIPYTGTTEGGTTAWNNYNCSSWRESGPEKVHKITKDATGRIEAVLSNHSMNLNVFILSSCSNNACVAYGEETAVLTNAQQGTYYIVVDGNQGAHGAYTLTVYLRSD